MHATETPVRFNRDVRPILSQNCFACHGFDAKTRAAELRLDIAENAYGKGESGKIAIVPGKVDESEVWRRINLTDPDDIMPPPKHHAPLTSEQREVIRRWIEQGAKYEGHWAFVKPEKPAVPVVAGAAHPIDAFVAKSMQEKKLSFSSEADRGTLIRRVTLDLTGLPPSPQEVQAFVQDQNPQAYDLLVDRLLASPHFGERMAMWWLDAARYADTDGFQFLAERTVRVAENRQRARAGAAYFPDRVGQRQREQAGKNDETTQAHDFTLPTSSVILMPKLSSTTTTSP